MTTPISKRKPNERGEFLLDVTPTVKGGGFFIYDVTAYLSATNGLDRSRMLERANHTIKGKKYTVYVIDSQGLLSNEQCKRLVIFWYENADNDYRLD